MNLGKIWLLPFLSMLLLFPVLGWNDEKSAGTASAVPEEAFEGPPAEITYSFVQNLSAARVIRHRGQKKSEAEWRGNRFQFVEALGTSDVFYAENFVVNGSVREAIAIQIQPGFNTTLIFSHVPPGKTLRIFIAMPDLALKKKETVPVDFEIRLGQKKILESRVGTKGWKREQKDLTLPFLLQRNYVFTVRARSVDTEPKTVLFYGYIE